jgi:hypothetical protein
MGKRERERERERERDGGFLKATKKWSGFEFQKLSEALGSSFLCLRGG